LKDTLINQIFNATTRIYTDTDFHCSEEYTALAAVSSGVRHKVWYYEFNRTY
jgi:hypothetical protein